MVDALTIEIERRAKELTDETIETLYFGGGTPSLLTEIQLRKLFESLHRNFNLDSLKETTIETNPEDIHQENLHLWKSLNINRLSIGLQSLNDNELLKMNRNHTAIDSKRAVEKSIQAGFNLITIDLIYGTPWKSDEEWIKELEWALNSGINHLSAYALTVEPKTQLAHLIERHQEIVPQDDKTIKQFELLQGKIAEANWDAYEISNYCKPGNEAMHNSNYWAGKKYIGIGPSAHSFDGNNRRWNVANNANYIKNIELNLNYFESECLTVENRINESIMIQLRTQKGLKIADILEKHPTWLTENLRSLSKFSEQNLVVFNADHVRLTNSGKMVSDYIISELMV